MHLFMRREELSASRIPFVSVDHTGMTYKSYEKTDEKKAYEIWLYWHKL